MSGGKLKNSLNLSQIRSKRLYSLCSRASAAFSIAVLTAPTLFLILSTISDKFLALSHPFGVGKLEIVSDADFNLL